MKADQLLPARPPKHRKEQQAQLSTLLDQGAKAFVASGSHDKNKGARNGREVALLATRARESVADADTNLALLSVRVMPTHTKQ